MVTVKIIKRLDEKRRVGFLWLKQEILCEVEIIEAYGHRDKKSIWLPINSPDSLAMMKEDIVICKGYEHVK